MSTDSTAKTVFEETVKSFVGSVSHHLSDWLKEHKEIEISSQEICTAFNVPFKPPVTPGLPSAASMSNVPIHMPGYMKGIGGSPKRRGGRQKKIYDENHPKCIYTFTRGAKSGTRCNQPCLLDESRGSDQYCKNCLKKAAVKNTLSQAPPKSKVAAPVLENGVSVGTPKAKAPEQLDVVQIENQEGMYREVHHGFIVKQEEDGSLTTMQVDVEGVCRELSEAERKIALNLGLNVVDNSTTSVPVPPVPSASEASTIVPEVPQMPIQVNPSS